MPAMKGGDKFLARLTELNDQIAKASEVKVGFLEGSVEADGTSIPFIASIQEFGSVNSKEKTIIPPRPFFRTMIASHQKEWPKLLGEELIDTDYNAEIALERMGLYIGGELQQSIIDTNEPALSPITVMLRDMRSRDQSLVVTGATVGEAARKVAAGESNHGASTKPLVDSGDLLRSVSYQVDDGEKVEVDPNIGLP